MPTLFRFLLVVAVLAALGFAAMFSLATMVEPEPREISDADPQPPPAVAVEPMSRARAMTGARHAGLFLDMLASERGASRNTLDAYRRDLEDYLAYLAESGTAPDKAEAGAVRGFMGASRSGA